MKTLITLAIILIATTAFALPWALLSIDNEYEYPPDVVFFELLTSDPIYINECGCDSDRMVILSTEPPGEYGRKLIFVCGDPLNFCCGEYHYQGMDLLKSDFNGTEIIE
jgi:hypothetical protein